MFDVFVVGACLFVMVVGVEALSVVEVVVVVVRSVPVVVLVLESVDGLVVVLLVLVIVVVVVESTLFSHAYGGVCARGSSFSLRLTTIHNVPLLHRRARVI